MYCFVKMVEVKGVERVALADRGKGSYQSDDHLKVASTQSKKMFGKRQPPTTILKKLKGKRGNTLGLQDTAISPSGETGLRHRAL